MKYVSFAAQRGEVIGQIRTNQEWLGVPQTPREELAKLELAELQRRAEELRGQLLHKSNGAQAGS